MDPGVCAGPPKGGGVGVGRLCGPPCERAPFPYPPPGLPCARGGDGLWPLYSLLLHGRPPRQSWPVSAQQFRVRVGYSFPALEKFPTWGP